MPYARMTYSCSITPHMRNINLDTAFSAEFERIFKYLRLWKQSEMLNLWKNRVFFTHTGYNKIISPMYARYKERNILFEMQ